MKKANQKPTDSELKILQILWENGPSSVREVNDQINISKEVGYTTTLKIMQIMTEKGLVERNTENRTHIYSAAVEQHKTQTKLLMSFVESTFRGSTSSMIMQALGNQSPSKEELLEIKKLIEKLENE